MQRLALATALATGVSLALSGAAEAGGWGGSGYNTYYGPYGGHIHHNVNPYTATRGGGHLHWHDTSHYHYVPPQMVRPGFLYRLQPGGYYLHRDGHWDLHH
jgi:hypothetical protein